MTYMPQQHFIASALRRGNVWSPRDPWDLSVLSVWPEGFDLSRLRVPRFSIGDRVVLLNPRTSHVHVVSGILIEGGFVRAALVEYMERMYDRHPFYLVDTDSYWLLESNLESVTLL